MGPEVELPCYKVGRWYLLAKIQRTVSVEWSVDWSVEWSIERSVDWSVMWNIVHLLNNRRDADYILVI